MQSIESGKILASNGSDWCYFDETSYQKLFGPFSNATKITNGVGAVCDEQGKWALISDNGELLTEYMFDGVIADQKGIVCRTDAVVVEQGGRFYLVDHNGNRIGEEGYSDIRAFNDGTLAAAKKGSKWLFLDDQGIEHQLGDFEEAQSFSNGLAAVKKEGTWGYIDTNGVLVINNQFSEVSPFGPDGVAFVKGTGTTWNLLRLYRDNH